MRLEFRLLVIDDNPESVGSAIRILDDYLKLAGFALRRRDAADLSAQGVRELARRDGRDFDLVIVDYNLGRSDTNGAQAAARMRRQLPFTDIIFYSTDSSANLHAELAKEQVAGVFIAYRTALDDYLVGVAETIIGKAVDLSHMRGIAMAEVAEMDVMMEEILERAFGSTSIQIQAKATETLTKLLGNAQQSFDELKPIVEEGRILDVVGNTRVFSSAVKYMALRRVAKCLSQKPVEALAVLASYEVDIIRNRNTLAHAKEDVDKDGNVTLRSIKRGQPPVQIDEAWMIDFRGKLRSHRIALSKVCSALDEYLNALPPAH